MSDLAGAARALWPALCALVLLCSVARAQDYPRDRAALRMIDRAVNEHYLQTEFDEAERILLGTVTACDDKCAPATLAKAWMYIGIVRGTGKNDPGGAREAFRQALASDARVTLDVDLAQEQTREAFENAQRELPQPPQAVEVQPPPQPAVNSSLDDRQICPPDLPGCAGPGDVCRTTRECQTGLVCAPSVEDERKRCSAPVRCSSDAQCDRGICERGACQAGERPPARSARHWFGADVGLDLAFAPAEQAACSAQGGGRYRCYVGAAPYIPQGDNVTPTGIGISSGFTRGSLRFFVSYAYVLPSDLALGLRVGIASGGAPQGFLPLHAELRVKQTFGHWRLHPTLLAGGGVAQVDAPVAVTLPGADGSSSPGTAYAAFGRFFVCAGAGLDLSLSEDVVLEASVPVLLLFPDTGVGLLPTLGLRMSP